MGAWAAVEEARRRAAYDALAEELDKKLEWHELLTGIKAMRWWMMRQAKGEVRVRVHRFVFLLESLISPRRSRLTHRFLRRAHQVLEVAAGTGRNFAYYPAGTKLTATDCSEPMVDVCRAKGEASRGPRGGGGARFAKLDVKVDDAARMKFKTG